MSYIEPKPVPEPVVMPQGQQIQLTSIELNKVTNQHFNNQQQLIDSLTQVWANPFGLDPQTVITNCLGTNAVTAFKTSSAYVTCVETVNAINGVTTDTALTALLATIATYIITYNADGSITVVKTAVKK